MKSSWVIVRPEVLRREGGECWLAPSGAGIIAGVKSQAETPADWRALCAHRGVDPREVERVATHYAAHRDYLRGAEGTLSLEAWFRFYRMEKASEAGHDVKVGGCSATGDAPRHDLLSDPAGFLAALRARVALMPPETASDD